VGQSSGGKDNSNFLMPIRCLNNEGLGDRAPGAEKVKGTNTMEGCRCPWGMKIGKECGTIRIGQHSDGRKGGVAPRKKWMGGRGVSAAKRGVLLNRAKG